MRPWIALIGSFFTLTACGMQATVTAPPPLALPPSATEEQDVPYDVVGTEAEVAAEPSSIPPVRTVYKTYDVESFEDGEEKVYFLCRLTSLACQAADRKIEEWFRLEEPRISVYFVAEDNWPEFSERYGAVAERTFFVVDGQGNAIQTLEAPPDIWIRILLGL